MSNQIEIEYLKKGKLYITHDFYVACYLKIKGAKYLGIRLIENPHSKHENTKYKYRFVFFPEVVSEKDPDKSYAEFKNILDNWGNKENYDIRLALEASSTIKYALKEIKMAMAQDSERTVRANLLPFDAELVEKYKKNTLPHIDIAQ